VRDRAPPPGHPPPLRVSIMCAANDGSGAAHAWLASLAQTWLRAAAPSPPLSPPTASVRRRACGGRGIRGPQVARARRRTPVASWEVRRGGAPLTRRQAVSCVLALRFYLRKLPGAAGARIAPRHPSGAFRRVARFCVGVCVMGCPPRVGTRPGQGEPARQPQRGAVRQCSRSGASALRCWRANVDPFF